MLETVRLGGDVDTNAAIAGALLGMKKFSILEFL